MSSPEFYDNFIAYQIESGVNDRIYNCYKRMKKQGINNNSSVLEIGCGIGVLTYLLSRKIKKGVIEAMDLSEKSVDYAKKHIPKNNISFTASNIFDFTPKSIAFDFVTLFDVIEHVPIERHQELFAKISGWMHDKSTLLINLPNPEYILFDQKNQPEVLQEMDQAIFLNDLSETFHKTGLEIKSFETHSIWTKEDYHFFIIKKKTAFKEVLLSKERSFLQKAIVKLKRSFRKIFYSYPKK